MSSPTFKGLGRRLAMIGALAALMVGLSASTAFASVELSPEPPYEMSPEEITVKGKAPEPGITHFALAHCNFTNVDQEDKETFGKECDIFGASAGLIAVGPEGEYEEEMEVRKSWEPNYDFTEGMPDPLPGTGTDCTIFGFDPCAVVVAYYEWPNQMEAPKFITAEFAYTEFS